jgi:putative SOS response-associated peptidase YedK
VVLTREANDSMRPVHDRMPLILTKEEVRPWVVNMEEAGAILTKELPQLVAERPYEQMTFEW